MKLYHPEHGEWTGEPVDGRILLERGWQSSPIVVPEVEAVQEDLGLLLKPKERLEKAFLEEEVEADKPKPVRRGSKK